MFELDQYDRTLHRGPALRPDGDYQPAAGVAAIARLRWVEHCTECAAPQCYSSCDLYQPRADLRCRRFTYGMYRNPTFNCLRGYGVEIKFKKWAKLETPGTTAVSPLRTALRWERRMERAAAIGNRIGAILHRVTGRLEHAQLTYIASDKLIRALNRRRSSTPPDAFLLEVYNPADRALKLQVIFRAAPDPSSSRPAPAPLIRAFLLPPGYSRHEIGSAELRPVLEGPPFLISMLPEGDQDARLVFLSADLVRWDRAPQSAPAESIKCVVWDLDRTLWNGVLVEGDTVVLRPGIANLLKRLDERGILLSVASKNDFATAWTKLTELGVADYFLYPQIDWRPKSHQIKTIAQQLNIGLDTFAFIDDNPFELGEAAQVIPGLVCVPTRRCATILSDPRFAGSRTAEALTRRRMYQSQVQRERELAKFDGDYLSFLRSCKMVLRIAAHGRRDAQRVAELAQRTNQLNFSGRKYTRDQLDEVIADPALGKYILSCSDRYGDYGTVGFGVVREHPVLEVIDFMLSCRVQGRLVEQAFFSHLLAHHNPNALPSLLVNFNRTKRNQPARAVLEAMGLQPQADDEGATQFRLDAATLHCEYVSVQCDR